MFNCITYMHAENLKLNLFRSFPLNCTKLVWQVASRTGKPVDPHLLTQDTLSDILHTLLC